MINSDNFKNFQKKSEYSLLNITKELWNNLSKKRRNQSRVLIILMLISSFAELISFTSIIPFLSIFTEKDLINNPYYNFFSEISGLTETKEILNLFIIIFAIAALVSSAIRTFNLFFNTRLAASIGSDISYEAYKKTIYQPYNYHINVNSSEILASFTTHISAAVSGIFSLFQLATSSIIAFFLIIGVLLIQLPFSILPPLFFGLLYTAVAKFLNLS